MERFANMIMIKTSRVDLDSLKPLKKFITDRDNPKYFITLTEINKIGINPRSRWNNVVGVYCYPLTSTIFGDLIDGTLPFAGNKPYINLFTLSEPVLNLEHYSEKDLEKDLHFLIKNNYLEKFQVEEFYDYWDQADIWDVVKKCFDNVKANSILKNLGYNAIYDPGMKKITRDIETQAVILNPSIIVPIETFLNPIGNVSFENQDWWMMREEDSKAGSSLSLSSKEDKDIFEKKRFKEILVPDFLILKMNTLNKLDPEYLKFKQVLMKKIDLSLRAMNLEFFKKIKDLKDKKLFSEILSEVIFKMNNYSKPEKVADALIGDVDLHVLDLIFNQLNYNIQKITATKTKNEKFIESLLNSAELAARSGIAENENIDSSLLLQMLKDPNEGIRSTVKRRLIEMRSQDEIINQFKIDKIEKAASYYLSYAIEKEKLKQVGQVKKYF